VLERILSPRNTRNPTTSGLLPRRVRRISPVRALDGRRQGGRPFPLTRLREVLGEGPRPSLEFNASASSTLRKIAVRGGFLSGPKEALRRIEALRLRFELRRPRFAPRPDMLRARKPRRDREGIVKDDVPRPARQRSTSGAAASELRRRRGRRIPSPRTSPTVPRRPETFAERKTRVPLSKRRYFDLGGRVRFFLLSTPTRRFGPALRSSEAFSASRRRSLLEESRTPVVHTFNFLPHSVGGKAFPLAVPRDRGPRQTT